MWPRPARGRQYELKSCRYSDGGTFTLTQSNDATATVRFNGTGVTVFGSKRGNHNLFTTTLDGDVRTGNGQDTQAETFNQTLFASSVLSNADHTLVIRDASTNTDPGQSYFDIDYVRRLLLCARSSSPLTAHPS